MSKPVLTLIAAAALILPAYLTAQTSTDNATYPDKVYTSVEQMPVYPGGEAAMSNDISRNLRYPQTAMKNGVQGRVFVQFVVKKDGTVGDVKVVRGKDPDIDKEAKRVVKTLKRFKPGTMNGEPVNVWHTLPVTFKLSQE